MYLKLGLHHKRVFFRHGENDDSTLHLGPIVRGPIFIGPSKWMVYLSKTSIDPEHGQFPVKPCVPIETAESMENGPRVTVVDTCTRTYTKCTLGGSFFSEALVRSFRMMPDEPGRPGRRAG